MKKHFLTCYIISILVGASVGWVYADYQADQIDPLNEIGEGILNENDKISLTITVEYQHSENASLIFPPLVSNSGYSFFSNLTPSNFLENGNLVEKNSSLIVNLNSTYNASGHYFGLPNSVKVYRTGYGENVSQITIHSTIEINNNWDGTSFDWFFNDDLTLRGENDSSTINQIKITGYMVAEQINDTCVWQFSSDYFYSNTTQLQDPILNLADGYGNCKEVES